MGSSYGTSRPTRLSHALRCTLLLLLLALALTSTVSYAQEGTQEPTAEVDAVVEPPPPQPEPEPPAEPPPEPSAITLPPAEPGEDMYIAEVAIGSAEQLAALQQLGYSCGEGAVCEIEATESQVSALEAAGFAVDIVGVVGEALIFAEAESLKEIGALEAYRYGSYLPNIDIPNNYTVIVELNIGGAPSWAKVTRVKYDCRVAATSLMAGCNDYSLEIRPNSMSSGSTIWNRWGNDTDRGRDDDPEDDKDIDLDGRWINSDFDSQPVNQKWRLRIRDHNLLGSGYFDYWRLWVYYCIGGPAAPSLITPANDSHTCDITPNFRWSTVSGANRYNIQIDDSSSFTSPARNITTSGTSYTASPALPRKKWYWRVRALNECGTGPWSSTRSVTIDSYPAVPVLQTPGDGSHTCDTTPYFNWADAAGATGYRIMLDDNPAFSSPTTYFRPVSNYTPAAAMPPDHYYWRVRGESACGNSSWSATRDFYIDRGPATPSGPLPADGATGVSVNADLNWADAARATSYDVYFGTSSSPPRVGTVTASQYNLPTLTADTMYYWKIVAKSSCGNTSGPVWRFRTVAFGPNRPPFNGTISPNSGGAPAGSIVYFTSSWSDRDGSTDLKACRFHVGRWAAPKSLIANAVMLYQARTNKILLRNDAGTRWWGGKLVGSANVVQNSQVKVYCNQTTVSRSALTITVRWAVEFKPAFRGRTKMYLKARDLAGATSPLEQKGTWTVQ